MHVYECTRSISYRTLVAGRMSQVGENSFYAFNDITCLLGSLELQLVLDTSLRVILLITNNLQTYYDIAFVIHAEG